MEPEIQPRPSNEDQFAPVAAPGAGMGGGWESRGVEWVFFGEDGLRVGWRIAMFALLMKVLFRAAGLVVGMLHGTGGSGQVSASDAFLSELAAFVTVVVAVAVMARIEERTGCRTLAEDLLRGFFRCRHWWACSIGATG
jgi:hypothetical protein